MSKLSREAIRILNNEKNFFTDWNELVYYFPEIQLIKKSGKLVNVQLPKGAFRKSLVSMNNKVYTLGFELPRTPKEIALGLPKTRRIQYESPLATKSILMDLVRD